MTKVSKWLLVAAGIILGLALLTVAGAWRLGLLPLLFPPLPAIPERPPLTVKQNNQPPTGAYQQPLPPSATTATDGVASAVGSFPLTRDQLQKQIEGSYTTQLRNLAEGYEGKLNSLVSEAHNELESDKQEGKKVPVLALYDKYYSEGNALEKQCDAQFYPLLNQFEAVLQQNNLPLDTALRAKQEYEYAKANRKKELLSAATKII